MVKFTQPDGKVLATEGKGAGKVLCSDIVVTPTVVTYDKRGNISLPRDPRKSDGKLGHVAMTVPSHPDLHADLDIPVTYDYTFVASFPGKPGSSGMNGSDGLNGIRAVWVPSIRIIHRRAETERTGRTARMTKMEKMEAMRQRCKCCALQPERGVGMDRVINSSDHGN